MLKTQKERTFVEKIWGWEDWIANSPLYCGKKMFLKKGYKCSYHFHRVKDETFFIESGKMLLRYGNEDDVTKAQEITLVAGDSFYIPIGLRHQFEGVEDTEFFEFSTQHFDEDSIRVSPGGKA